MNLQPWVAATAVSGAILSVSAVIVLIWKVARSMWQRARKEAADLIVTLQATSADFIGVKDEVAAMRTEVARLVDRADALTEALDEHIVWHNQPGGRPARPVPPQPNGRPPRRP